MLELIGWFTLIVLLITVAESESHFAYVVFIVLLVISGVLNYQLKWIMLGSVVNYVKTNPGFVLLGILGYIACGALYILLRWYWYVQDCWELELERRENFKAKNIGSKSQVLTRYDEVDGKDFYYKPEVIKNKERIFRWGSFWVFSFVWNLVKHPLRNVYKFLLRKFGYVLDNITNSTFKSDSN